MSSALQQTLDLIDGATIVADTSSLIVARSENPGETELRAVEMLEAIASRLDARTERQYVDTDRYNLTVRFGPEPTAENAGLLFLGHSDVVPAGGGWDVTEPFLPRVVDGELYGRGSTDMKGGLAAVMQAMAAVNNVRDDIPLTLVITVDEEDLATGILRVIESEALPYRACIVAEPTNLATVIACRGAANIEVTVTGAAAHAGRPEDGVNAITAASRIALLIAADHERMRAGAAGLLGSATWNVGRIEGGHGTSIVPDLCTLLVDRRLMPAEHGEAAADALREMLAGDHTLDGCEIDVALLMQMPGFETSPEHPLVASAVAALAAEGHASAVEAWTAACEGGYVHEHHGCPVIILGPGDITTQAHQPNERVSIAHLETAARAYARIIYDLADGEAPAARTPQ